MGGSGESAPPPPGATRAWRHSGKRALCAAGPALLAVGLAVVALLAGWHGTDLAGATYRVDQARAHGLVIWDTGWYGGNYPLAYSAAMPFIGAFLGLPLTGILSAGAAAALFDLLIRRWWGRRLWGSWWFAASTLLPVAIGQLPYLTGETFALGAVLALARRWRLPAAGLAALAALCSGVAAAFLVVALLGWALGERLTARGERRAGLWPGVVAVVPLAVVGAVALAFPGTGPFPFPVGGLVWVLVACALTAAPQFRGTPAIRAGAVVYAVLALASFWIPNPMGGNADRLAQSVGIALLACGLEGGWARTAGWRRSPSWARRSVAIATLAPLAAWQWGPGLDVVSAAASGPSVSAGFYRPLLAQLSARHAGPLRIEIPPTRQHWEAAYVAPHVALARGWERQVDIGDNPIFYRTGALTPASYARWLAANGVSYVALADTTLDYAGRREASLLRSGKVPDLRLVWRSPTWSLWLVTDSPGLVSGPAALISMHADRLVVDVERAATITVRVRWTAYWSVASPAACVVKNRAGWTEIEAGQGGTVTLEARLLHRHTGSCPGPV